MSSPTPQVAAPARPGRLFSWAIFCTLFVLLIVVSAKALEPYGWRVYNPWDPVEGAVAAIENLGGVVKSKPAPDGRTFYYVTLTSRYHGGDEGLSALVALDELADLDGVYVENSTLTDAGMQQIGTLSHLDELSLACPKISDAGVKSLGGLAKLRWINLTGTQTGNDGLAALCGLKSLEKLTLTGTKVTDSGLAGLASLPNLKMLWLDFTEVSDAGVEHLLKLEKLERLWVDNTQITPEAAKRLSESREGLDVVHFTPTRFGK